MSDKKSSWSKDSDNLMKLAVAEEAVNQVWGRFEAALSKLDAESLDLFQSFLQGTSVEKLAQERKLTAEQTQDWLKRVKREVNQSLRTNIKVRH